MCIMYKCAKSIATCALCINNETKNCKATRTI